MTLIANSGSCVTCLIYRSHRRGGHGSNFLTAVTYSTQSNSKLYVRKNNYVPNPSRTCLLFIIPDMTLCVKPTPCSKLLYGFTRDSFWIKYFRLMIHRWCWIRIPKNSFRKEFATFMICKWYAISVVNPVYVEMIHLNSGTVHFHIPHRKYNSKSDVFHTINPL